MKGPKIEPGQQLAELLSDLERTGRVRRRRGSYDEAEEIEIRLQEWCDSIEDPREGCALLLDFFRADDVIFCHCGVAAVPLGMIFTFTAKDRFTSFASRCPDKEWLCDQIMGLLRTDRYALRSCLLEDMQAFLPEASIRALGSCLQAEAKAKESDSDKQKWCRHFDVLAKSLKELDRVRVNYPKLGAALKRIPGLEGEE